MPHARTAQLLAAGLALAPLTGSAAASTQHPARWITITEHSVFEEPPSTSGSCAQPGPTCLVDVSGPTHWHGDIEGDSDYLLHAYVDPSTPTDLSFNGPNTFRRTTYIRGCGRGSFVAYNDHGHEHLAQPDASTQSFSGENDWTIVPGSGTGQLRGISGHGHDVFTDASASPGAATGAQPAYTGRSGGQITCIPHKGRR